jgi:hypothetical protein
VSSRSTARAGTTRKNESPDEPTIVALEDELERAWNAAEGAAFARSFVVLVRSRLEAPSGPLAGEHRSLFTMVLVKVPKGWRIAAFHNTLIA